MNCFVECILAFGKVNPFFFRLETIGQVLPFVLAYVEAPSAGLNQDMMSFFVYAPSSNPYGDKFRVLTYSVGQQILCYGIDITNRRFVQVGILVWEEGKPRIAYCENSSVGPIVIAMSRTDRTHDFSRVLFGAWESYLGTTPSLEASAKPPVVEISSESESESLKISSEEELESLISAFSDEVSISEVTISDIGGRDSTGSIKPRSPLLSPRYDPIENAMLDTVASHAFLEEFPEHVQKLKSEYIAITLVTEADATALHSLPTNCIGVYCNEMQELRGKFEFHADRFLHDYQVLYHAAIFLTRLQQFAHQANAEFPLDLPQAQQAQYAELITAATARHEIVKQKTHIEACRKIARLAQVSSKFIDACKRTYEEYAHSASFGAISDDHLNENLRAAWTSCNEHRGALFGALQAYYDEQVTFVQCIRDALHALHRQSRSPSPSLSQAAGAVAMAMDADA